MSELVGFPGKAGDIQVFHDETRPSRCSKRSIAWLCVVVMGVQVAAVSVTSGTPAAYAARLSETLGR